MMDLENNKVHVLDGLDNVKRFVKMVTQEGVQEDSFFVLDIKDLVFKYKQWIHKLPRVKPHYAVKCNDCTLVLDVLASLGCSFDCASKSEIQKVMDLGVDGSRIVYANPTKSPSHIRYAKAVGIELTTFDNESELHKIKSLYPTTKLLLRIRSDAKIARVLLGDKYGCDVNTEAPELLRLAASLGLNVVGICFHVGSGCVELLSYARGIAAARGLFKLGKEMGFNMNILDIGGGYIGYKNTSIDEVARVINVALDKHFPIPEEVNVISEPGQYFVASAFTLSALIISKREVKEPVTRKVIKNMYYINDGIFGSFLDLAFDAALPVPIPLSEINSTNLVPSIIWGPTCDSCDLVLKETLLPDLDVGEWLMFENMGAYTLTLFSSFNGFPVPNIYAVVDSSTKLLLKNLHLPNGQHTGEIMNGHDHI